jgi:hypothetical protein
MINFLWTALNTSFGGVEELGTVRIAKFMDFAHRPVF